MEGEQGREDQQPGRCRCPGAGEVGAVGEVFGNQNEEDVVSGRLWGGESGERWVDKALGRRGAGESRCEGGKGEGERAGEVVAPSWMCAVTRVPALRAEGP